MKQGVNYWMISTIILALFLIASLVFIFTSNFQNGRNIPPNITIGPTQTPSSIPTQLPATTGSEKLNQPVSSENTTETDGKYMGFIKRVYTKNGKYYVDIDYVQWLTDGVDKTFPATKACVEDKQCLAYDDSCEIDKNGNCIPSDYSFCDGNKCARTKCGVDKSCLPNGYYIRNQNPKIRTFELSTQAIIENLQGDGVSPSKITTQDFLNIFSGTDEERKWLREAPYNVVITDELLTKISQQYRP